MKGTDERDGLFARLFGLLALIESGCLFASLQQNKSAKEGAEVVGRVMACLVELGGKKGWLRESAWWGVLKALEGAIALPEGEGRKMALEKVYEVVRANLRRSAGRSAQKAGRIEVSHRRRWLAGRQAYAEQHSGTHGSCRWGESDAERQVGEPICGHARVRG